MKGAYPPERQRVWVWGEYELRYVYPPKEVEGHHPLWINRHFLEKAEFRNNKLVVGDSKFNTLYIDVEYMDYRALNRVLELAKSGLPVCIKDKLKQPGKIKSADYNDKYETLISLNNVSNNFSDIVSHLPIIQGDSLPDYWCRVEEDGTHYLFLAQTLSKDLKYPVYSGQSYMGRSDFRKLTLNINGVSIKRNFEFKPYQSLMLRVSPEGKLDFSDISFVPKDPIIRPREKQRMHF